MAHHLITIFIEADSENRAAAVASAFRHHLVWECCWLEYGELGEEQASPRLLEQEASPGQVVLPASSPPSSRMHAFHHVLASTKRRDTSRKEQTNPQRGRYSNNIVQLTSSQSQKRDGIPRLAAWISCNARVAPSMVPFRFGLAVSPQALPSCWPSGMYSVLELGKTWLSFHTTKEECLVQWSTR